VKYLIKQRYCTIQDYRVLCIPYARCTVRIANDRTLRLENAQKNKKRTRCAHCIIILNQWLRDVSILQYAQWVRLLFLLCFFHVNLIAFAMLTVNLALLFIFMKICTFMYFYVNFSIIIFFKNYKHPLLKTFFFKYTIQFFYYIA
jgi:hypothetical protein